MTSNNKYLIIVYTVTSGQHFDELGSDEQEIVLFAWLVLDIVNLQIIDVKCKYVKPKYCEKLSETVKNDFQITEQMIEENGQYLENVLEEFDQYVRNKLNYDNGNLFNFVTDGQQHFRQVLHPECVKKEKNINLPEYFYSFFDLKKEFRKFLRDNLIDNSSNGNNDLIERSSTSSIDYQSNDSLASSKNQNSLNSTSSSEFDQLIGDTQLKMNSIFPNLLNPTIIQKFSIPQMLKELQLEPDSSAEIVVQAVKNMANVIINLISNGHVFDEPETINMRFEPGICSRNEIVDSTTIVRARGLPWQSSDQDIFRFFKGLNIHKGGIALCLSAQGRRNGEALIRFTSIEHRELALKRNKHFLGQRYIELYRAKGEDFLNVAAGNNNEAQQFLQKGAQVIIRMRGLPYETTAQQVVDFFASHQFKQEPNDNNTEIINNKNKVSTETKSLVENNEPIVEQDQKQNQPTIEEKMEISEQKSDLNNNEEKMEKKTNKIDKAPYCRVMDVLFLKRKDGRSSGDAFVLFSTEKEGQLALTKHRQLIGTRYIELFRSSNSEVQQVFNKMNEQNQLINSKSNILNQTPPFTSFISIHHQSTNAIYQAATTNLPLINSQPTTQTIINAGQQPSTMQTANNAVLQSSSLGSHHLHHHPSSVTYSGGHTSFHHQQTPVGNSAPIHYHQLTAHAQHSQNIQQQQHNLTSHANPNAGGNYHQANANSKYAHLQSQSQQQQQKQHLHLLANASPTTCTINKPHSVCTSPVVNTSPVNSLNTSNCNGQLISCSKVSSSTNSNGNLMNRPPLFCIQPTATVTQTSAAAATTTNTGQYKVVTKDCIRLRGLPFEANVDQILDFLGEHSSQIVYQGIHLIYTLNGAFSGEAFLQMRSEYAANQAALSRHNKYMQFGKKQRYIEVIQCCLDDMLLVSDNGQYINSSNHNLVNGGLAAMQQRALNTNTVLHPPTQYFYLQNHLLSSSRASHFYPHPPIIHQPVYWSIPSAYYSAQSTMPIY